MNNKSNAHAMLMEVFPISSLPTNPWLCIIMDNDSGPITGQAISNSKEDATLKAIKDAFDTSDRPHRANSYSNVELHITSPVSLSVMSLCMNLGINIVCGPKRSMGRGCIENKIRTINDIINRTKPRDLMGIMKIFKQEVFCFHGVANMPNKSVQERWKDCFVGKIR